uniref:3-hydroxyisobutyryl-CoA hydrolase n=1 Tax=Neogobius melanostomus TaxID=47308 RepID=A0A8C6TCX8_9GOBI
MSSQPEPEVLLQRVGRAGVITMNRPKVLNALNLSMIRQIYPQLKVWIARKPAVTVAAEGLYSLSKMGKFGKKSSCLCFCVFQGVGLSVHGRFRVATEKTLFAMPETGIGLFPDVGGGHFLPRLQGKLGLFLALTGFRLKGRDVHRAGVATHFVDSSKMADLEQELVKCPTVEDVSRVLDSYQNQSSLGSDKPFTLEKHLADIDRLFSADSVEQIVDNLRAEGSEFTTKQAETLSRMSPTSLKMTFKQLQLGGALSLKDVLIMEYRMSQACMRGHDFYEGVRAVLVDKDQSPRWSPSSLEQVSEQDVDSCFSSLGPKDLVL